jgi:membrane protein YdbS with pleckstrin-like domain
VRRLDGAATTVARMETIALTSLPTAARTRWRISNSIGWFFPLLLLTVPTAIVLGMLVTPLASLVALLILPLCVPIGFWWADKRYARFRYALATETLTVRDGVLVHTEAVMPLYRVQHIDLTSGPLQLRFKLATLTIHSAAPIADITLPDLHTVDAERMRDQILEASRRAAEELGVADVDAV